MMVNQTVLMTFLAAAVFTVASNGRGEEPSEAAMRVFLLDPQRLEEGRRRVQEDDARVQAALERLRRDAEQALSEGPFSVLDKTLTPASGDKHDYFSFGPYWWPNPDTPDGLPYVRRDGDVNPQSRTGTDSGAHTRMTTAVETLAFAFALTNDQRYAEHAAMLLRTWFIDEATRMNPHLQFGQAIPGRTEGRSTGIIETRRLARIVDAVGLLAASETWSEADQQGMLQWMETYLDWLVTSPHGRQVHDRAPNNIATWYDVQVVSLALFVGREDIARRMAEAAGQRRIATQIEPDGSQPHELARTRSLSYSVSNLAGMFELATLAQHVDVDLWRYRSAEGASLQAAIDYLVPYAAPDARWPHPQMSRFGRDSLLPLLWQAAIVYDEPRYDEAIEKLSAEATAEHRYQLLWPRE